MPADPQEIPVASCILSPPAPGPTTHDAHLAALHRDGYTILRRLLPPALIARWRAAFQPLWAATEAAGIPVNRGPGRRYLDLPFHEPFDDPGVLAHPTILALLRAILGEQAQLLHLGTDTPGPGSEDQDLHADVPDLFPGADPTPPFAIAVNIPLVAVTTANGPFAAAPGTHRLPPPAALQAVREDPARLVPVVLEEGDVLVRDPRMVHRGTANRSGTIRPVAVIAFQKPWYRHGAFEPIALCPSVRTTLPPALASILQLHLHRDAV